MKKLLLVLVLFFVVSLGESYATPTFKRIGKTILSKRSNKHRNYIMATNRMNCKLKPQHYKQKYHKIRRHKILFIRY